MLIKYIFEHIEDKDIQTQTFTIDEIEHGNSLEYIHFMKEAGYNLINRWFEKYI